jgi:hypothetical protein
VLLLAVGHDATVLCVLRCQAESIAATECHQQAQRGSTTVMMGEESCWGPPVTAAILTKDDLRGLSGHDERHAVPVPRYQTPAAPGEARQRADDECASPHDSRPLVVVLRI